MTNHSSSSPSNTTTAVPLTPEEEYERQFFILRVLVLGTIGCVFSTLLLLFWVYFMYLWKTWDSGSKRDQMSSCSEANIQPTQVLEDGGNNESVHANESNNEDDIEASDGDSGSDANSQHHPHFDRNVMRSRRKSVSFAVCKVNADTMQFDIEHKSVLLGNLSASANASKKLGGSNVSRPPASPLREVARKWQAAKNKLVLKEKLSNVILGSSNLERLEFEEESFRNRRRELMEKAKALEEAAAKAKEDKRNGKNIDE